MSGREAVSYLPEKGLYCQRLPGRRARKGKRADTMGFYGTLKMIFYKVSTPRRASPPEGCSAQGRGGAGGSLPACRLPAEPCRAGRPPPAPQSQLSQRTASEGPTLSRRPPARSRGHAALPQFLSGGCSNASLGRVLPPELPVAEKVLSSPCAK